MRKLTYKEKFIQMDREAAATAICAVVIMAAFWAALLLLKDSPETLFEMPLWFSVSCLGGYVLSVVASLLLLAPRRLLHGGAPAVSRPVPQL